MQVQQIILENGEDVIMEHKHHHCEDCKKEIFIAVRNYKTKFKKEKIKVELVGLAEWDLHKCVEAEGENGF